MRAELFRSIFDFAIDHPSQIKSTFGAVVCGVVIWLLSSEPELRLAAACLAIVGTTSLVWSIIWAYPAEADRIQSFIFPPLDSAPRRQRSAPIASQAPLIRPALYRKTGAVLFFSVLILLFNPFVAVPGHQKFAILTAIVCTAVIWATPVKPYDILRTNYTIVWFFALYGILAVRMNHLDDPLFDYQKAIIQPLVWLFLSISSLIVARRVGIRFYATAMTAVLSVICLALLFNYRFLLDPQMHSPIGDFTFDSYQQVSTVFGVAGIVFFIRGIQHSKTSLSFLICIIAFAACAGTVLITPARGELIAFLMAIIIVNFPRLFIGIAVAVTLSLPTIITIMDYYNLPSVERFKIALDLGWEEPRVILVRQSLSLISNDPFTFFFGQGANYFQKYYQLPEGMHPHNFILELWISGGIILAIISIAIFVLPVLKSYRRQVLGQGTNKEVFALCLFFLVLSLKSTAITSNWLLALALPYFVFLRELNSRPAERVLP